MAANKKTPKREEIIYSICSELENYANDNGHQLHVDFFKNRYFDYEDEEIVENYEIWYNCKDLEKNLEFQRYLRELQNKYKSYDYGIFINCNWDKIRDHSNKSLSNINARTLRDIDLNIYELVTEEQKDVICAEAKEEMPSEKPRPTAFDDLRKKARECLDPRNYNKSDENIKKIANQINKDNPDLLTHIRDFLKKYGIVLLCKTEEEKPHQKIDGLCGFADNGRIPIIIIYIGKGHYRRLFFTIAHEMYHLLFDDNEYFANRFAGALLLREEQLGTKDPIKNEDALKQCLVDNYKKNKISMECILNGLYSYNKIDSELRGKYLKGGRLSELIKLNGFKIEADKDKVFESLGK